MKNKFLLHILAGLFMTTQAAQAAVLFSEVLDAGAIDYSENFSSLGTGNIAWNDGSTVQGWYMRAALTGFAGDSNNNGIPNTVYGRDITTLGSTGAAYHIGNSTDRALSWVRSTTTGLVYLGNQFQNDGASGLFDLGVRFNMEQWRAVLNSTSTVTLQYRVTSTGGNILNTSGWTTIQAASLPNTSTTGNVNGHLSANRFTLGGSIKDLAIDANEYLSFRIVGNIPNGAGFGVGSAEMFSIMPVPEPTTLALALLGLVVVYRGIKNRPVVS